MRFDRKVFFSLWRPAFGPLRPEQVVSIEALLAALESDRHITDVRWAAYMLATVYHETAATMAPIDEYGSDAYFNRRYGPQTSVGRRLGNTQPGDGALYHGRGFVQLTGRRNYRVMSQRLLDSYGQSIDLVAEPDRAKDVLTAYRIMSVGMRDGSFTGKALRNYIYGAKRDYTNARRIINGTDRAALVAGHAMQFERILRSSAEAAGEDVPTAVEPDATLPVVPPAAVKATLIGGGAVAVATGAAVATSGATDGASWMVWAVLGVILMGIAALVGLWLLGRGEE